jgi:hypothetical protein
MRLHCAVVLQLMSFYSFAGSTSTSLLVTVTVVRPAPVTSASNVVDGTTPISGDTPGKPATSSSVMDAVRYITVNY